MQHILQPCCSLEVIWFTYKWTASHSLCVSLEKERKKDQMLLTAHSKWWSTTQVERLIQERGWEFMWNERLGYILTCPSNLGTGLRAGVHVKLPLLSKVTKKDCAVISICVVWCYLQKRPQIDKQRPLLFPRVFITFRSCCIRIVCNKCVSFPSHIQLFVFLNKLLVWFFFLLMTNSVLHKKCLKDSRSKNSHLLMQWLVFCHSFEWCLSPTSQDPRLSKILDNLRLQKRGTGGVDTAAVGGVFDISNLDRLGQSEVGTPE